MHIKGKTGHRQRLLNKHHVISLHLVQQSSLMEHWVINPSLPSGSSCYSLHWQVVIQVSISVISQSVKVLLCQPDSASNAIVIISPI